MERERGWNDSTSLKLIKKNLEGKATGLKLHELSERMKYEEKWDITREINK